MSTQLRAEPGSVHTFQVDIETPTQRLDVYVANQFPAYSRNFFQQLIDKACISVNGKTTIKSSCPVKAFDAITVTFPERQEPKADQQLVDQLGIKIVFEHEHFFIIYKPAGVLVHAPSVQTEKVLPTVVDWIVAYDNKLKTVGCLDRPGIVHRLDKDTSGLLIISRTNYAHTLFGELFRARAMNKRYYAIVEGHPQPHGIMDFSIRRDPVSRVKMSAVAKTVTPVKRIAQQMNATTRDALTHYSVVTYFTHHSLLDLKPITGRTHQIRVHCSALGHPLVGDYVYGNASHQIKRHALHAYQLSFVFDGIPYTFTSDMPDDMKRLLAYSASQEK